MPKRLREFTDLRYLSSRMISGGSKGIFAKEISMVAHLGGGGRFFFSYDIFVHGSKFQFIDGINLNLTHVCVCCEIIFVFTYIALVVFVY